MVKLTDIFNVANHEPARFEMHLGSTRKLLSYSSPKVVSTDQLDELLDEAILMRQYKVLRFLLRVDGTLMFAHEGYPGGIIPAHYQMADSDPDKAQCIAAGNAYFDKKTHRCCIINHKSGDFRPPFETLWFALNAFAVAKVPMNEQIQLERLDYNGSCVRKYSISKKDILIHRISPTVEKLVTCGTIGAKLTLQIRRLESGVYSYNPYWVNSSKKLNAIIDALPTDLTEASLKVLVRDPTSDLYKALNMRRLPSIFGQQAMTTSLQNLQNEDNDESPTI